MNTLDTNTKPENLGSLVPSDIYLFEKYIKKINPKKILEWGPGVSTKIIKKLTDAEILSIEHHGLWYKKAKGFANVKHIEIKKNTSYATIAYEHGPFDMIFIDGRRRVECAIVAKQVISPGGVIMLHDKNRENYMRPLRPHIKIIEEGEKTIVFK